MENPSRRDVVVSAGHGNFHMLFTAAEMERRGRLSRLICGAYPTPLEQMVLGVWPFKKSRKLNRFANRAEILPADRISQNRASELLGSTGRLLSRFGVDQEDFAVAAFHMYGHSAGRVLRSAAQDGARIYHYRAGFGQSSVAVAKELGMRAICDHSIVHPALLNPLVELRGKFPEIRPNRPGGIWGAVLDDIEAANLVVVNSDFVAETFRFMGFDPARLVVVYQGVEDKFIKCLPGAREFYQKSTKRPVRFLFAGGIVPRKGVDEIAAALAALSGARFELHLAGSLSEDSRRRYAGLLADPRVTYHGMLSQVELSNLMSQSDVFLFPSCAEGSARVVFEAMAAGCAVITTPNSGSVAGEGAGIRMVPVSDASKLCKAILEVMDDPASAAKNGLSNQILVMNKFRQSHYGDALERVFSAESMK